MASIVEVIDLVDEIKPMLADRGPDVQGAILAELVSIWIAGHAPQVREEVLAGWLGLLRGLVMVNELELFGPSGHPLKLQ